MLISCCLSFQLKCYKLKYFLLRLFILITQTLLFSWEAIKFGFYDNLIFYCCCDYIYNNLKINNKSFRSHKKDKIV